MKCEECVKSGLKSIVYVENCMSTCMPNNNFYDEDGKFHSHDPNTHSTSFSCDQGHKFGVDKMKDCWCGWPNKKEVTVDAS